ncbi:MAG TPA: XRE family transcriptional regulator [Bryobacteraceae bacterium]|nr:XRE family transcriptional regulator [Bryobacteraceae bacterium]HPU74190.1 XRE family transcriptional regulator [Bryobacteraceae bacterium]
MPITAQELGGRLRIARQACGLTQDDVARFLGMSRSTVAQMELGNRAVTSLELDKLAYFFGRDIREFVAETFEEEDALAALFRAEPEIAGQPAVADSLRAAIALGREITNIENLLGIDRELVGAVSFDVPAPRSRWEAIQQGERAAEQERRRMGLGWAPAPPLPELFETQGVRTGVVDLPDDVSGLTISNRRAGLFILANRRHVAVRRRFSFAHEYAHTLFDRRLLGTVSRAENRDALIEVRANAFAAAFLMPSEGVRQSIAALGKGKPSRAIAQVFDEAGAVQAEGRTKPGSQDIQLYDLVHIAHHFGVSRQAALFRLLNLRLVTQAEFDQLKTADDAGCGRELASLLSLPDEDEDDKDGFRHRVLSLGLEAYRRELITRAKLVEVATLLSMEAEEIQGLLRHVGL